MDSDIAFILKGRGIKEKILNSLLISNKTAKMISVEQKKHLASISRALLSMEKKGYVKCTNPEDDKFRFYAITEKGKEILKAVNKLEYP